MRWKTGVLLVLSVLSLAGCAEIPVTTSHYGSGLYRCYFHDSRTNSTFEGVGDSEQAASRKARYACRKTETDHLDYVHCRFADCVFR